jgi:hypothetical protein
MTHRVSGTEVSYSLFALTIAFTLVVAICAKRQRSSSNVQTITARETESE